MGVNPKILVFPPKWMVKIMENPIKIDDLGGPPLFLETPICLNLQQVSTLESSRLSIFMIQNWLVGIFFAFYFAWRITGQSRTWEQPLVCSSQVFLWGLNSFRKVNDLCVWDAWVLLGLVGFPPSKNERGNHFSQGGGRSDSPIFFFFKKEFGVAISWTSLIL